MTEIPIWTLALFIITQTGSLIWLLSSLSNRVQQLEKQLKVHDKTLERLASLETHVGTLAESVRRIEVYILRRDI